MVEYRDVAGFPGYRVASDGTIWSRRKRGGGLRAEWRLLRPWCDRDGYYAANLYREGRGHTRQVHRLILEAFVGPCPDGMETRHLNGDPADNRLENLAWGTRIENEDDKLRHGRRARGERHHQAKLTWIDIVAIRALAKAGRPCRSIAEEFGVGETAIHNIIARKKWRHVP